MATIKTNISLLPLWQEFPDIELYMDQLVNLCNRSLNSLIETPITASMVNSYVKKGLITRPVKKRYTSIQLAELILLSLFKTVYSLEMVEKLLPIAITQKDYDTIALSFNQMLKQLPKISQLELNEPQQLALQTVILKKLTFEALK